MRLPWLLLVALPAAVAVAPHALMLSLHIVQKASTSGALFRQYGSDAVVAVVMGLITLALFGWLGVIVAHFMSRRTKVTHQIAASQLQTCVGHAISDHSVQKSIFKCLVSPTQHMRGITCLRRCFCLRCAQFQW